IAHWKLSTGWRRLTPAGLRRISTTPRSASAGTHAPTRSVGSCAFRRSLLRRRCRSSGCPNSFQDPPLLSNSPFHRLAELRRLAGPGGLEPATLGLEGCVPVSEAGLDSTGCEVCHADVPRG